MAKPYGRNNYHMSPGMTPGRGGGGGPQVKGGGTF